MRLEMILITGYYLWNENELNQEEENNLKFLEKSE